MEMCSPSSPPASRTKLSPALGLSLGLHAFLLLGLFLASSAAGGDRSGRFTPVEPGGEESRGEGGGSGGGSGGGVGTGRGPGSRAGGASLPSAGPPRPERATLEPPSLFESHKPTYPGSARRRGAEGLVVIRARVGLDGRVVETRVERSSGAEDLDRSAAQAVRGFRFHPGTRGSRPVEAWVNVPVRFSLNMARL
jgi:protein TonB